MFHSTMDCIVQPQSHPWTGAITHGLPSYHQRNFFPNFYFPRKGSFSTPFYPGPSLFFPHDDDVDYPTDMKGELAQTMSYHGMTDDGGEIKLCVVCGERASGFYFGALVCLPCKSFYIRCTKDGEPSFTCQCNGNCDIVKQGRIRCQYCRYQRCLMAGMCRKEKPETVQPAEGQVLCKVCGDIANGIHFGVNTCEGCKKFFRRGLVENQSYICKGEKDCAINPRNRNNCRYCRYQKCLTVGMSREAIKMGRPKKGDGSDASCTTASPKGTRQTLVDVEINQTTSTNPHLGEDLHDTLKSTSVSTDIKEENVRSSCDFEKKMSTIWSQDQTNGSWQPCSQGHVVSQSNQGQSSTTVTSSEFIEEEMDEILLMLQNDNQSGGPVKKMRYDYSDISANKPCKTEFDVGIHRQWGMNEMGSSGMQLNEPMNMTTGHVSRMASRPPPQYPGYSNGFQQKQGIPVQNCMPVSPCHSPNSQMASPGSYVSDSSLHSPGYVPNGSPAHSPSCQYSPQHSPMYQHSPSPHSPYHIDTSPAGSPYHETVHQHSPYSPQDNYKVTDLSVNVNCGQQSMMTSRSPLHHSPHYHSPATNLSSTSPSMTNPHQEGGVNSHEGWCLTGLQSFICHSPSHNSNHMTIPNQEGFNRRSSSRFENLQKINRYFMSPSSCDLQLVPDSSHDGTMTRSDIEEEVVHKTLASMSPAESFYYVLNESHSCSSDSNCSTNYDEFTSCQRQNKRKSCDGSDMHGCLRPDGSTVGRYQPGLTRKYWQASVDREMAYPMTSDKQALLEHLSKIFQQMTDRCTEPIKQLSSQDSHCWQQIQMRIVRNTSAAVKFASQIPGFSSLHPEDKAFLCKSVTFMSALLMAGQCLYSPAEKNFRDFWNWQITPENPFYPFKEQMLLIGGKIHGLNMDIYEVSAMASLLYLASDFLDLAYPEAIEDGRRKIIAALKSYLLSKGVDVQARLSALFSIIPDIRHVGTWHHELMKQMKINVQKQELHQLFDAIHYRES